MLKLCGYRASNAGFLPEEIHRRRLVIIAFQFKLVATKSFQRLNSFFVAFIQISEILRLPPSSTLRVWFR